MKKPNALAAKSLSTSSLAPVQRKTLEYLRNFIGDRGYAPTLKDIAQHIGVRSLSTAHFHLERLEDKGFIVRGDDGAIKLLECETLILGPTAVPMIGAIAAGLPIEAIEIPQMIDVPSHMISNKGEVFCLEVHGESMIDAHICDGDVIIVKKQDHAENGEIVVALLEDNTATLKTYKRLLNGKVMLIPANPTMQPMVLDKVSVQGTLVGVMRKIQ